jgi:hypothetical protein
MNERIKELIDQCTSYSDGSTWTSREEFDKEKFAQLLIRECADHITESAHIETLLGNKLLEHFGVGDA